MEISVAQQAMLICYINSSNRLNLPLTSLLLASNILHHTSSLTVQLRQRNINVVKSLKLINLLKTQLNNLSDSVTKFTTITKTKLSSWQIMLMLKRSFLTYVKFKLLVRTTLLAMVVISTESKLLFHFLTNSLKKRSFDSHQRCATCTTDST